MVDRSARTALACVLVALTAVFIAPPARAKPTEPAPAPAAPSAPDAATREKSRAAFRRGVVQLRAQDWAGARASFEEAWSLVQHPSILLNLGIARLHTDDPVAAEQDLVRFLSEDPDAAAEEQASAREALTEARAHIGTLRVVTTPSTARVFVDGKPLAVRAGAGNAGQGVAEGRFKVGEHALVVDAEGYRARTRSVDVKSKSDTDVKIVLTPAAPATPPPPPPPSGPTTRGIVGWSLAGTAGVALATSGILGLRAISLAGDYKDRTSTSFQHADVKSEGIAFRTGADIALVVGVLSGAGAVVLLFTHVGESSPSSTTALSSPGIFRW